MLHLFDFLRRQPPRPTARELAEASEFRLKNAKEAAARERQRLIVEWLRTKGGEGIALAEMVEAGEPLKTARPEGHPPGPRPRR